MLIKILIHLFIFIYYGTVRDKNKIDKYDNKYFILTRSSIFHVSDTFSHLLTIHHSTQQCAENIFEYQHFRLRCCIKSHYAKPPRIGLRYLPQNSKSTTFCPVILYVSDTFPCLQTGYNSTRQRAENLSINVECLRHSPQHYQRLPLKPIKARFTVQHTHLTQTTSYTYIQDHTSSAQYQAVALWPGWVLPKRYCSQPEGEL